MDKSYRDLFFAESQEYLKEVNKSLVALEKNPRDEEAINTIFRLMHTLKGMAATMRYNDLAEFAHKFEDAFDAFRMKKVELTPAVMDIIFESVDVFIGLVEALKDEKKLDVAIEDYLIKIDSILPFGEKQTKVYVKEERTDGLNIAAVNKLRAEGKNILRLETTFVKTCSMRGVRAFLVLNRAKELGKILRVFPSEETLKNEDFEGIFEIVMATVNDKNSIKAELSKISEVEKIEINELDVAAFEKLSRKDIGAAVKKIQSMRIPVERLDKIMNLMGELSIAKSRLVQVSQSKDYNQLDAVSSFMARLVASLQDEALKLRLLPISFILDNFPRMVRDLSRQMDKDIELAIAGSDIELDRVILDEIGDPLVHLIRNAIDHGIESESERLRLGKDAQGKIAIKVFREKGHIIIEVSDDGRGMDFAQIIAAAKKRGFIAPDDKTDLDKAGILDILTIPGFSTKDEVTDISGRGVGLDVVRNRLDMLGGRLEMDSQKGKGTTFILTLPLTLAIIKAMLISLGDQIYAIPLMNIRETVKVAADEIKPIKDMEVIRLRDEIIPVLRLSRELGVKSADSDDDQLSVVIVEGRAKSLGLVVDKVLAEQDVVVKPLGAFLKRVRGITGATILGDGRVVLILDVVNVK